MVEGVTGDMAERRAVRTRPSEPGWLPLAKRLQRRGVRGGFRLERLMAERWPDDLGVSHRLAGGVELVVPIGDRRYDRIDVDEYEHHMVDFATELLRSAEPPVTLIDCGADFGMVSAKLVANCPAIDRVIAFEPNPEVFDFLAHNLSAWPVQGRAVPAAVADINGRGELRQPAFDSSAHAAFLVPDDSGDIDVVTLDSLGLAGGGTVVIKIDVEGGERAVLRGAARLLAEAADFAVLFEAHPRQAARVGIDTVEVVAELLACRPCRTIVTERPDLAITTDRPFRDQVGDDQIYNICVTTLPGAGRTAGRRSDDVD